MRPSGSIPVYLETGSARVFAGAVEWPGWCRRGRSEEDALAALLAAGPRYAGVLRGTRLGFRAPPDVPALTVTERLPGNATTDFGAPDVVPAADAEAFDDAELRRSTTILRASWRAFDRAVERVHGRPLATGPRGGGRELAKLVDHVVDADASYLMQLGATAPKGDGPERFGRVRDAILAALGVAAREGFPSVGPRGGARWPARYFVRRSAWHVLDHAWEVEDRIGPNLD